MCKGYKASSNNRFQILARLEEQIFHIDDLAALWNIRNPNTLYVTIHRYITQNLLYKIYKGFYALKAPNELDPNLLGIKAMHQYCYLSTETVLAEAGIIQQISSKITFISAESRKFTIGNIEYYSRQLKDLFLYNPCGINDSGTYKKAGTVRAIADLLYYNRMAHFDNQTAINWKEVRKMQKEIGYPLTEERYK